jgi:hypothetical protein
MLEIINKRRGSNRKQKFYNMQQEILEKTNSPAFLT